MSATNWTTCPKCEQQKTQQIKNLNQQVDEAYGNASQQEYVAMTKKLQDLINEEANQSLREDYEIGIWEGYFEVTYFGSCSDCGFIFEYEHTEIININPNYKYGGD